MCDPCQEIRGRFTPKPPACVARSPAPTTALLGFRVLLVLGRPLSAPLSRSSSHLLRVLATRAASRFLVRLECGVYSAVSRNIPGVIRKSTRDVTGERFQGRVVTHS